MKKNTIDNLELLGRGVVDIIIREELGKKLASKKKLRVKLGIDPTGSDLHIGHGVVLRKLKQFQDRGDTIILLIGDFTAKIGDPTGKSETRKMLSEEEIKKNMQYYVSQASKIIDIKKLEIRHNSEWFNKMTMRELVTMAANKTIGQLLQREDFRNRIKNNQDISTAEIMYPIMQGYDSVMLDADIEIGGTDQLFNMLVGRDMQKGYQCKNIQDVVTVPILEGLDGIEKMSKSLNNYIGITETPENMYGKAMSIPDALILKYLELTTEIPLTEIEHMRTALKEGENPRNLKMRLARELVTLYHGTAQAKKAEGNFVRIFQKKEAPEEIPLKKVTKKTCNIVDLLFETGLTPSKSEARRLIDQGGISIDGERILDHKIVIHLEKERLLKVGKRTFIRLIE